MEEKIEKVLTVAWFATSFLIAGSIGTWLAFAKNYDVGIVFGLSAVVAVSLFFAGWIFVDDVAEKIRRTGGMNF